MISYSFMFSPSLTFCFCHILSSILFSVFLSVVIFCDSWFACFVVPITHHHLHAWIRCTYPNQATFNNPNHCCNYSKTYYNTTANRWVEEGIVVSYNLASWDSKLSHFCWVISFQPCSSKYTILIYKYCL